MIYPGNGPSAQIPDCVVSYPPNGCALRTENRFHVLTIALSPDSSASFLVEGGNRLHGMLIRGSVFSELDFAPRRLATFGTILEKHSSGVDPLLGSRPST